MQHPQHQNTETVFRSGQPIAIIGMAGKFPGADTVEIVGSIAQWKKQYSLKTIILSDEFKTILCLCKARGIEWGRFDLHFRNQSKLANCVLNKSIPTSARMYFLNQRHLPAVMIGLSAYCRLQEPTVISSIMANNADLISIRLAISESRDGQ
ncbi:hypothetical protein CS542_10045 [Pedobacter sp. IW39]|nr:hypothetical protein CS542_10045 [Pedobacter sp. IW39]